MWLDVVAEGNQRARGTEVEMRGGFRMQDPLPLLLTKQ